MFSKNAIPAALIFASTFLANCGHKSHKPNLPVPNKTEEVKTRAALKPALASDLIGSWRLCYASENEAGEVVAVKGYPKAFGYTISFDAEGHSSLRHVSYKDAGCKTELSDADVDAVIATIAGIREETGAPEMTEDELAAFAALRADVSEGTYTAKDADAEGIGEIEITSAEGVEYQSYKIDGDKLFLSEACGDEDCEVVVGTTPENRSRDVPLKFVRVNN